MSRTKTPAKPTAKTPAKPSASPKATSTTKLYPAFERIELAALIFDVCNAVGIESPFDAVNHVKAMQRKLHPVCGRLDGNIGSQSNPHYLTLLGATATPPTEIADCVLAGDYFKTKEDGDTTLFVAREVLNDDGGAIIIGFDSAKPDGLVTAFSFRLPAAPPAPPEPTPAPAGELPFAPPATKFLKLTETRAERAECGNEVCGAVIPQSHILTFAADDMEGRAVEILPGNQLVVGVCTHCRTAHRAERSPDAGSASGWRIVRYLPPVDRGDLLKKFQDAADANKAKTPLTGDMPYEQDTMSHGVLDINSPGTHGAADVDDQGKADLERDDRFTPQ